MTPERDGRQAGLVALRLINGGRNHHFTSYTGPAQRTIRKRDETELSWVDMPDDHWPSDAWVVGADVDPADWPEHFGEGGDA